MKAGENDASCSGVKLSFVFEVDLTIETFSGMPESVRDARY